MASSRPDGLIRRQYWNARLHEWVDLPEDMNNPHDRSAAHDSREDYTQSQIRARSNEAGRRASFSDEHEVFEYDGSHLSAARPTRVHTSRRNDQEDQDMQLAHALSAPHPDEHDVDDSREAGPVVRYEDPVEGATPPRPGHGYASSSAEGAHSTRILDNSRLDSDHVHPHASSLRRSSGATIHPGEGRPDDNQRIDPDGTRWIRADLEEGDVLPTYSQACAGRTDRDRADTDRWSANRYGREPQCVHISHITIINHPPSHSSCGFFAPIRVEGVPTIFGTRGTAELNPITGVWELAPGTTAFHAGRRSRPCHTCCRGHCGYH